MAARTMSRAAFSAKVFALYLFLLGVILVVTPNTLLTLFRMAPTTEVWIHIVGVVVFMIGVYAWVAAKHEDRHFLEASVYTRCVVFVALTSFGLLGMTSRIIILFGAADLLGGVWTYFALKADARAASASTQRPS